MHFHAPWNMHSYALRPAGKGVKNPVLDRDYVSVFSNQTGICWRLTVLDAEAIAIERLLLFTGVVICLVPVHCAGGFMIILSTLSSAVNVQEHSRFWHWYHERLWRSFIGCCSGVCNWYRIPDIKVPLISSCISLMSFSGVAENADVVPGA